MHSGNVQYTGLTTIIKIMNKEDKYNTIFCRLHNVKGVDSISTLMVWYTRIDVTAASFLNDPCRL